MGASDQPRRLSRTLFWALFALAAVSLCIAVAVSSIIFFAASERQAENSLLQQTQDLAAALNREDPAQRLDILRAQYYGQRRITYIASDGTVVYDSAVQDVSAEENHGQRPEIVAAARQGSGVVSRLSSTVGIDTVYAAVQLSDGSFVRLSENRTAVLSILGTAAVPLLLVLLFMVGVGGYVASRLARRVVAPLNEMDVDDPDPANTYAEVAPLVERIDVQQKTLKRQNADLKRANEMRREFSSNVTHEMKTPLHVIAGYAELLQESHTDQQQTQVFAEKIHHEASALSSLVDDVLVLSRMDEQAGVYAEMDLLDVNQAVRQQVLRFQEHAQAQAVVLEERLSDEPVLVCMSRQSLEEIVGNLIENAIRYNRENGRVRISAGRVDDMVEITVADTGIGIAPVDRLRIFERFYRADPSRSKQTGGTGLGLAIVKHAVQAANGTVTVDSVLGEGSAFTVRLPAAIVE